jgi:hypothetical protein
MNAEKRKIGQDEKSERRVALSVGRFAWKACFA